MNIPDQVPIWDKKHNSGDHDILRGIPSPLAQLVVPYFPRHANILELGCGVGRDAVLFAENGHRVMATDGSSVVIEQNLTDIINPDIIFRVVDMREKLPYEASVFDVVFANLSLHYYSHEQTTEIIKEIARVLKSEGIFALACKSYDSLHNEGEEIEPNVYASPSGATIHLFSKDYAKQILEEVFYTEYLDEIDEEFKGRSSKIVRCIAKKYPPMKGSLLPDGL